MSDIRKAALKAQEYLKANGADTYAVSVSESEQNEFNYSDRFDMLRTVYSDGMHIKVIIDGKLGTASGNDISDEGVSSLVLAALAGSESAEPDPARAIAPFAGRKKYREGPLKYDEDALYAASSGLIKDAAEKFPKVLISGVYSSHVKGNGIYLNSNGTEFETEEGAYQVFVQFAGNDGKSTTSLNYAMFALPNLDTPLIEMPYLRRALTASEKSLGAKPFSGKFTGTAVLTPDMTERFLDDLLGNYISGQSIMKGTSRWMGKIGKKVAHESLSVVFDPFDRRILNPERITSDGFEAERVPVIENGVLKNYMLDLYAANKTGLKPTKNDWCGEIVAPGNKGIDKIIGSVKEGILVGGFSGGEVTSSGEFSGVAKNSFIIRDGKIAEPVTEAMINGNIEDFFLNIKGISRETEEEGSRSTPYIASDGIVVSGK
ncbi:MAG: TldD/PmbA family protein [Oscillospiraceae bacterium]|jgi:PmbA protein